MAYGLDLTTGAVGPFPSRLTPAPTDTAYLYLYRPLQAGAGPAEVSVFLDGRPAGVLRPGQYLEVPWYRSGKPLRLCFGGLKTSNPCQYLVPNAAQLSYLRITPTAAARPWQWVPAAQGSAELDALDKQQEKK